MKAVHFHTYALGLQCLALTLVTAQYVPPTPTITPLCPRGIRLSIPDEDGITLVAYHVKFNEDFNGLEAGTIARDIVKVKDNRWTYEDRTTRLKVGDEIYMWIHVIYDGLGYNLLDQNLRVTVPCSSTGTTVTRPPPPETTTNKPPVPTTCYSSSTVRNGQPACAGELIFEDNFEWLDSSKWRIRKEFSDPTDEEFVLYDDNVENLSVNNGNLRIKPTLMQNRYNSHYIRHGNHIISNCTSTSGHRYCSRQAQGFHILPPVISGLLDTRNSFTFLYGRVEIRAKFPQGDWIYPVIALQPVDSFYGSGYLSGQLRIASVIGNRDLHTNAGDDYGGRILRAGAVISRVGPMRQNTMSEKTSTNYWSDSYHIYELEWSPSTISVKVDGQNYGTKNTQRSNHRQDHQTAPNAPFDKAFYLSIGVAVGGVGEFPDDTISVTIPKPWRNIDSKALFHFFNVTDQWANTWPVEDSTLKVDYVKIWAL